MVFLPAVTCLPRHFWALAPAPGSKRKRYLHDAARPDFVQA